MQAKPLRIQGVNIATNDEWDTIFGECDYATYFHSREWAGIWSKYTHEKMRPTGKVITFSDSKTALLPFSLRTTLYGVINQYISSPVGTFGGWLSLSELSEDHVNLLYQYVLSKYKNLTWRINPFDPLIGLINIDAAMPEETQVIDLEGGSNNILNHWMADHSSTVRKARKAEKLGVLVREAQTMQHWKEYYRVYENSLDRWGKSATSVYEWSLFNIMFVLKSPRIKLWLAIFEDQIISGALCFYAKRHVAYWHGAALSNYFNMRPVNLLMYEIIKDARARGYRWFDFNPSGGHEGVEKFKSSFGPTRIDCPIFERKDPVFRIISWLGSLKRHL